MITLLLGWYAVKDVRGLAPEGWHIPSETEMQILIDYLGGNAVAGGKLKEVGTINWDIPNTGATNESEFTALPGGRRHPVDGKFMDLGNSSYFWTTTPVYSDHARILNQFHDTILTRYGNGMWEYGCNVRCIKD